MNTEKIAIHESKNSEKVVKFVSATIDALQEYVSIREANNILNAIENNSLHGLYFTPSGKLKAVFVP
jgi:hypothetical protein